MRDELWAELERVLLPAWGEDVLRSIGFPADRLPSTDLAAGIYWRAVRRLLDLGVLEDGEGRLARAVHSEFQGNAVFRRMVWHYRRFPTLVLVSGTHHGLLLHEVSRLDPRTVVCFAVAEDDSPGLLALSLSRELTQEEIAGLRLRLLAGGAPEDLDLHLGVYDHHPYLVSQLRVNGPDGQPYDLANVPSYTPVRDLIAAVLAHSAELDQRLQVLVHLRDARGGYQRLDRDHTLHEAGIAEGAVLDTAYIGRATKQSTLPSLAPGTDATWHAQRPAQEIWRQSARAPEAPTSDWHLTAEAPTTARLGVETGITVLLDPRLPDAATSRWPAVTPGDTTLALSVVLPRGVEALNGVDRELRVRSGSADPVRIPIRAQAYGRHTLVLRVWSGGTYLGSLDMTVRVPEWAGPAETATYTLPITRPYPEHGEAALQVVEVPSRGPGDGLTYQFQLRSDEISGHPVYLDIRAGHREVVDRIRRDLRELAAADGKSEHARALKRTRAHGIELWDQLIPEQIRREFRAIRGSISSFSVAAADSAQDLPWELLFPESAHGEDFLVDEFPFSRQYLGGRRPPRQIFLDAPAFVMAGPDGAAAVPGAVEELEALYGKLCTRGGPPPPILDSVHGIEGWLAAEDGGGLLHLALHNLVDEGGHSVIPLRDGGFRPLDLAEARRARGLAERNPLVFVNGCGTARLAHGLTELNGWATNFMDAGARNFIGTQWPVRTDMARAFAEAFYEEFAVRRLPIGPAVHQARLALRDASDDPTRLAYTLHGDPWGCAAWQGERVPEN